MSTELVTRKTDVDERKNVGPVEWDSRRQLTFAYATMIEHYRVNDSHYRKTYRQHPVWDSLKHQGQPIEFASFVKYLTVTSEAMMERLWLVGCRCVECIVFRATIARRKTTCVIPNYGHAVRAFIMPRDTRVVTLYMLDNRGVHKVWSKRPDSTGRVLLTAREIIPLAALLNCTLCILEEPKAHQPFEVEYLLLTPETSRTLITMDLGIYHQFLVFELLKEVKQGAYHGC